MKKIDRKRFFTSLPRDVGIYPSDTGVMRSEFKPPNERLDKRFRVVEPRMYADSLMRKVVDEWISRFNIRRMFSRFRLTKSDDHQRLFSLSSSLSVSVTLCLCLSRYSNLRAIDRNYTRIHPSLYNCNFSFRERDHVGVSSYAYVFSSTIYMLVHLTFKCILY